ncbi:oxygen-dependent coproporphyrinogen oxidase [Streptomyces mobaraensis NBRC 13819 = DSM 40847]|uniref:coproporphyrinogen oxidase n=1 Tax=Streptomyces mobaraensis (strain ATCC 29032 / DSM 40847 / JCM 4168 / NBRC 13819 / NCIMB 11159 / IPCR 16-22) TaxID=1223523 RepID=M3AWL9_STRM1|nr:oxygen-dependent coproporphyrinogen oxidase [Streptomyces mobaraensis]EME97977.1 coproporphyrinogen III oxidase [Streptomyces mobaraensis NBRC 13819 = DSM 40847]QTT76743.1 oxygen-dependent coproporphyrinogen oxidase [Streptomyces mobaraensis NBRC 13819 = DSM 40847]
MTTRRDQALALMLDAQAALIRALEECDGEGGEGDGRRRFTAHDWERPGGGGGWARVLEGGAVFERAGVNVSAVHGDRVPDAITDRHDIDPDAGFFATGLSTVLHPRNPWVPAFHANFRYFEVGSDGAAHDVWWFGGGADMTPSYGFEEDARHLHRTLKDCCDTYDPDFYARAKERCDAYFYLPHRQETRGVGGIFFDHLRPDGPDGWDRAFRLVARGLDALAPAYLPIVRRRARTPYGERERRWQLLRRGRYVEFNLLHDRGTRFGLESRGNTEAILMSLPPTASWGFDLRPEPGSEEERLADFLRPRDWLAAGTVGAAR